MIRYKALTNQQEAYFHESEPIGSAIHAVENKAQKILFTSHEETRSKPIIPSTSIASIESKQSPAKTPVVPSFSQMQQFTTDSTTSVFDASPSRQRVLRKHICLLSIAITSCSPYTQAFS